MEEGLSGVTESSSFGEIPPVIYFETHTRAVIARLFCFFFLARALELRGLLWYSTIYFRCGEFPLGSKVLMNCAMPP